MDIIILSTADWDNPFWTNKQHVAVSLAKLGHRVLYVDSLGLRQPAVNNSDFSRIIKRLFKFFKGLQNVTPNVWVVSPIAIPLQKFKVVRWFNLLFLKKLLTVFSKQLNFTQPILWTYSPITGKIIGALQEKVSVYHCVDEIKAQPGMPVEEIERCENELLAKIDVVFTTSRGLEESKQKQHKSVYYLPNVADFDHFHTAYTNVFDVPADLQDLIANPIVGFIGAVSGYKLDFELIAYLAKEIPNCNFVFIGKVGEGDPWTDKKVLDKYPNIYFLGSKDYNILPQYLQYFKVCILPCALNEYTRNMFPMKFFEYLAAGKPVVCTNLPALNEYKSICYLCSSYDEFLQAVRRCLDCKDDNLIHAGLGEAKRNTYLNRTKKMMDVISTFIDTKNLRGVAK